MEGDITILTQQQPGLITRIAAMLAYLAIFTPETVGVGEGLVEICNVFTERGTLRVGSYKARRHLVLA